MTDEQGDAAHDALTAEELDEQGELLPPRELMSIVDVGDAGGGPVFTLPVEPRDEI